jgi:REP-associated tyrosine transposase
MAIPKRHFNAPGTFFVTSRTWQNRALFRPEPPAEVFVDILLKYRDEGRYSLHAFVLMPDHFHLLLTPAELVTLERAVQHVKGGSSRAINERMQARFPVWQRGFTDHRVRDAQDYNLHLQYLLQNPVKKNLALSAGEYKWSSGSGRYRMDEVPQGLKPLSFASGRHG